MELVLWKEMYIDDHAKTSEIYALNLKRFYSAVKALLKSKYFSVYRLFLKKDLFLLQNCSKGKKRTKYELRYYVLRIHCITARNFGDKAFYSAIHIFPYEKKKSLVSRRACDQIQNQKSRKYGITM